MQNSFQIENPNPSFLETSRKGGSILKPLFIETFYYQRFLRISNN